MGGYIDVDQLCLFLDIPPDLFVDNMVEVFDRDGDGGLTFGEFLAGVGRFLTSPPREFRELVFRIFDVDNDGYIKAVELEHFMQIVHGPKSIYPLSFQTALRLYDRKQDNMIDFIEFEESVMNYPILMYNAQMIRDRMTNYIGGTTFWFKIFKRIHPEYANVSKFDWKRDLLTKLAFILVIFRWLLDTIWHWVQCKCIRKEKVKDVEEEAAEEVNVDWSRSDPFPNPRELTVRLNNEADPGYDSSEGSEIIQKYFPKGYDPSTYDEKYKMPDVNDEASEH